MWCDLHCFLRRYEHWITLYIFCVYICEGKQQQNKYDLGTNYSEVADAVTNFHPTSGVPDLIYVTMVSRVAMFIYKVLASKPNKHFSI